MKAKKMKKSGSIKRPKHPGKPPPQPTATPPPSLPNYMKSTTSSDARKESKPKLGSSSSKKAAKAVARTLTKNPSFKPARAAAVRKCGPVVICENLDAQRATCSSTLKDCKLPAYLSLSPGGTESVGTSVIKVCPYTYCSLNGHHHAPLPPLKCFLSARRRAVKAQRIVKLGCSSPRRVRAAGDDDDLSSSSVSPVTKEQSKDFFVEIHAADGAGVDETVCDDFDGENLEASFEEERDEEFLSETPVESTPNGHFYEQDSDGSDMERETGYCSPLQLDYDYECSPQAAVEPDPEADASNNQIMKDEFIVSSDGKDFCCDENLVGEVSQESFHEEGFSSDAFSSSDDGLYDDDLQSLSSFETPAPLLVFMEEAEGARDEENGVEPECKTPRTDGNLDHEASFEISNHDECLRNEEAVAVTGDESAEAERRILSKANGKDGAETETEDVALLQFTAKSKKLVQDGDEVGDFNQRAPNFLPLEADPEAEKVDLRHQDLDERKNAEEWMVDYALRQVVTKLGPARKRKVSLLVEAFEKVMPATKWDLQLRHGSAFDQARPIQACR